MSVHPVLLAFGVTLLAGLSTGIGSLIALVTKRTSTRFLSVALGFSAGFMIYVSMIDLFPMARQEISRLKGNATGNFWTLVAFFGGMILIAVIDRLVPTIENPHELRSVEEMTGQVFPEHRHPDHLMRMGFMSALAISIHNFPEGIATFTTTLHSPTLGLVIAAAIAIHNIPEGIAVSIPIYLATGSRRRAFRLSFLSGLSEPLGALLGYLILAPFMNGLVMGLMNAAVAGIMVFISLDELLPTAREYGSPHLAIYGLIGGMMVMALSLQMFIK